MLGGAKCHIRVKNREWCEYFFGYPGKGKIAAAKPLGKCKASKRFSGFPRITQGGLQKLFESKRVTAGSAISLAGIRAGLSA